MVEKFLSSTRNCIIMLCCFIIGIFIHGTARLSGQMFVASMIRYNARRKDASFPFTLSYTTRNIAGPVIAYLGKKFGAEAVTVSGCVLSAVGVGACFFAEHINAVIVFWGVLFGLGFGLGSVLVPEILASYFTNHYDKANGIFLGGSSLSAIFLPLLTENLLFTYGTSGTFLILSGLMLNCVVSAILLWKFKRGSSTFEEKFKSTVTYNNSKVYKASVQGIKQNKIPAESLEKMLKCSEYQLESSRQDSLDNKPSNNYMSPRHKKSIKTLNETTKMPENKKDRLLILEMLEIFLDPAFLIIVVTQSVTAFLFTVIWTVIVDFSADVGVPKDLSVYILMALAIMDCIARFFLGSITDAGYMSKLNFSALCYALLGITMVSLVAMNGLIMMIFSACALGLFSGGLLMIGSGIILKFIEKEKVTIALSFRYMLYPVIGFAQPYLIAYFRDTMGSYNGLFYLCAAVCWACCLLSMLLPMASIKRDKKKPDLEKGCMQHPSN